MNKFTRKLVYSSFAFAVTAVSASAVPIATHSGVEAAKSAHTGLRTSESVPFGGDITLSSFSDGERLAVRNTLSDTRTMHSVSMLTPSTGKVDTFGSSDSSRSREPQTADSDAIATPKSGDDLVGEISAAITQAVDSENLSIATTAAPQLSMPAASASDLAASPFSGGTPEPGSFVLAGLGWLLLLIARRKRS
jgi:hypothetical protein